MDWKRLCSLARALPEVSEVKSGRIPSLVVGGRLMARLDEEGIVMFAVGNLEERDALVALQPSTFFIDESHHDWPVILARLAVLTPEECRARLERAWRDKAPPAVIAAAEQAPRPAARCYFLSLWKQVGSERERRRFFRVADANVLDWIANGWRANQEGLDWGEKLRDEEAYDFRRMFSNVFDDGAPFPETSDAVLHDVQRFLDADAEPHFVHGRADDDEGTYIEYFIFDDRFLASEDALERLPHPDRGRRRDKDESSDKYLALIERLRRKRR